MASAVQHWLEICRQHKRTPFIKRAAPGGGGDSIPFEGAFSNLAHAYLKDRAPQLLDYELGFQLLEKNEDNDRAVGVFGFKVGPQLLYAPVFFLHGELQGHELLYLKESDTFVPMKENWVNYVLNRKPPVIGEHVMSQLNRLGVDRPSMDPFRLSPSRQHKYGSANDLPAPAAKPGKLVSTLRRLGGAEECDKLMAQDDAEWAARERAARKKAHKAGLLDKAANWLQEGLPGLMHALGTPVRLPVQVPGLVKSSAAAATRLLQLLDTYPSLAEPIVDCYGTDLVKVAIATAKTAATAAPIEPANPQRVRTIITGSAFRQKSAEERGLLQVWVNDGTPKCREGLTEKQATQLRLNGYFIKDAREDADTSKAYKELEDVTLANPTETGLYEILTKPGEFEKCLFVPGPMGGHGSRPNAVVVRIEGGGKNWTTAHASRIFTNERHSGKEYREWFNGLPKATSLETGSTYMLLTPGGQGSCVFIVERSEPAGEGKKAYKVEWLNDYGSRPDNLPAVACRCEEDGYADTLVLNYVKGHRLLCRHDAMYAPEEARVLKLKGEGEPQDAFSDDTDEYKSSEKPALVLGNNIDIKLGLIKASAELKVFNDGVETIINGSRMTTRAGLLTLVRAYGLREKAARAIMTEAAVKHGAKYRLKFADAYGSPQGALGSPPTSPPFPPPEQGTDDLMGSGLPTSYSQEQDVPIESMRGLPTRPNYADPPDPQMAQQIQQAAQTGQKEVLDTSMLSNLLRGSQNETLIDKHLPALMKGLDSLGRLMFNMYWHHDKFEERYGARDLADLKDSMRNAFDGLGDVTLELKQDAIEPFPSEGADADLDGDSE